MNLCRTLSLLSVAALLACAQVGYAAMPISMRQAPANPNGQLTARVNCAGALSPIDQDINNVRARLNIGDVWWNGGDGRYIIPKVAPGEPEVSSIYSSGIWLGGFDDSGNLKLAAQQYGRSRGNFDYYPGPLDPTTGEISQQECSNWDKFFVVNASEIREHIRLFEEDLAGGAEYTEDMIPLGVKGWPARGNPYFEEIHGFPPPNTNQGLAGFYDYCDDDGNCLIDGFYDPLVGDFPIIEIEGCIDFYNTDEAMRNQPQFPDQMIFWIYNDSGNDHLNSGAVRPLQMEVQVQAFAYSTNDALNNMTFQRYKLINRGMDPLTETFFGIWIDGDLGCSEDDFIGCDTTRSLAFYYNSDAVDGNAGATCGGVNTYGSNIPLIGIDYFRGPKAFVPELDSLGQPTGIELEVELGMSSFTYFDRGDFAREQGMSDPTAGIPEEFYNLLSGTWRDGSPYTGTGDGYQTPGFVTTYAFPSRPDDVSPDAWSMCSEDLGEGDRRTIQASGPFNLRPGARNELIIGVPWVPDEPTYPCPNIDRLLTADDLAQNLFDACFDITDGPDAPDMDIIELDRKLTLVLTNDTVRSNNAFLEYAEVDLLAPDGASDSIYRFEGYKVYQLRNGNVSIAELDDPTQARLIAQSDLSNGVGELYNWNTLANPLDPSQPVYEPEAQVESGLVDQGLQSVLRVTNDQFASGQDTRLINHKPYYFTVLSYAYNSYGDFDPVSGTGQPRPYLEGRNNITTYIGVPRPITDIALVDEDRAAQVTRLDGVGTGPYFLDLAAGEREMILSADNDNMPTYQEGESPVVARTYNPFEATDGIFRIEFVDNDMSDDDLDASGTWRMIDQDGQVIIENQSFDAVNEQIIGQLGISVTLGQVIEPGADITIPDNGCIGYELTTEGDERWFFGVPNKSRSLLGSGIYDFMLTASSDEAIGGNAFDLDPLQGLTECFDNEWITMGLATWTNSTAQFGIVTPAYINGTSRLRGNLELEDLNNVDVVFTADKDLWSRCVIVETGTNDFVEFTQLEREGNANQFDLRQAPSVGKEAGDDGLPTPDGEVDEDGDMRVGMGWFPGYAVDVETGQRLNIFFGENSAIRYSTDPADTTNPYNQFRLAFGSGPELTGRDMMFNPTGSLELPLNPGTPNLWGAIAGGQHFVYVTREPYDECEEIYNLLKAGRASRTREALETLTYATLPLSGQEFNSYAEGLIPATTVAKLRVNNPYGVAEESGDRTGDARTGVNMGYPAYELEFTGVSATPVPLTQRDSILSFINVVPNPYYGYSEYEIDEFSNRIRITNLPPRATVTIYTIDGKFIRQYKRAEELPGVDVIEEDVRRNNRAITSRQIYPDLDWDMKNDEGIPVASGVYLIHVDAFELGERTVKSFLLQRAFDPSGL